MIPNPLALIAELTHRCPLHCVYCSNPLELAAVSSELSTAEWIDIFQQSASSECCTPTSPAANRWLVPISPNSSPARAPPDSTRISSPQESVLPKRACKR